MPDWQAAVEGATAVNTNPQRPHEGLEEALSQAWHVV